MQSFEVLHPVVQESSSKSKSTKFRSSSKLLHPVIQELSSKSKSRTYKKKIETLVKCFLKQMQSFK